MSLAGADASDLTELVLVSREMGLMGPSLAVDAASLPPPLAFIIFFHLLIRPLARSFAPDSNPSADLHFFTANTTFEICAHELCEWQAV